MSLVSYLMMIVCEKEMWFMSFAGRGEVEKERELFLVVSLRELREPIPLNLSVVFRVSPLFFSISSSSSTSSWTESLWCWEFRGTWIRKV